MSTIWCLGSINIDMFYDVPHIPAPGETLAATGHSVGLGGKGANQSVAAAKAGATVRHIGAVGANSDWVVERLAIYGVDTGAVTQCDQPTGQAIITVAADGENAITTLAGANAAQDPVHVAETLSRAEKGDILLLQNETNLQAEVAAQAHEMGVRVFYSAAPFDAAAVAAVLSHTDTLLLNEIEADQLEKELGQTLMQLPVAHIVVTLGSRGARWLNTVTGEAIEVPGLKVAAVDTTGAGDTFAGYLAAGLSEGQPPQDAMAWATRAAALKVTRKGTADAIPTRASVQSFQP